MEANPCAAVAKSDVKKEKKRRALPSLIDAAPPDQRLTYSFLVYTGIRRGQAEQLCWGDLRLDSLNASVLLPATITKSGQPESMILIPALVAMLRQARGKARDGDRIFDSIPSMDVFRSDLVAAGIGDVDERGRKVVLHSLRHSLATMLAAAGVPMAVAQRIMRHRDIRLSAEAYTDEGLLPLARAMDPIPVVIEDMSAQGLEEATRTDLCQNCARNRPNRSQPGIHSR